MLVTKDSEAAYAMQFDAAVALYEERRRLGLETGPDWNNRPLHERTRDTEIMGVALEARHKALLRSLEDMR